MRRAATLGVVIALLSPLGGCCARQRRVALVAGGIAAMGGSLVYLRRGPFGPGDYVMTVGFGAAVAGTLE